jgi:hypothetical protein
VDATSSAVEDTALSVSAANGILTKATDPDSTTLTPSLVTQAAHGVAALNADGSFTYTPVANYCGPDQFGFGVTDEQGAASREATWRLDVACVNDAPVLVDRSYSATEDTALTVPSDSGVLAGASDVENDPIAVGLGRGARHGSVTVSSAGGFTYTPAANFCGPDDFTVIADDGHGSPVEKTIPLAVQCVNDAPTPVADQYTATDGTPLVVTAPGLLANDTDADGDHLEVVARSATTSLGQVAFTSDGSFTYPPRAGVFGTDSALYTVFDPSGVQSVQTVTFAVKARTKLTAKKATFTYDSKTRRYKATVSATLQNAATNAAISGQVVTFLVNGVGFCSSTTTSAGVATCTGFVNDANTRLFGRYIARFAGSTNYVAVDSASTPFGTTTR